MARGAHGYYEHLFRLHVMIVMGNRERANVRVERFTRLAALLAADLALPPSRLLDCGGNVGPVNRIQRPVYRHAC